MNALRENVEDDERDLKEKRAENDLRPVPFRRPWWPAGTVPIFLAGATAVALAVELQIPSRDRWGGSEWGAWVGICAVVGLLWQVHESILGQRANERPWVMLERLPQGAELGAERPVRYLPLTVRNFGRSPAFNVRVYSNFRRRHRDSLKDPEQYVFASIPWLPEHGFNLAPTDVHPTRPGRPDDELTMGDGEFAYFWGLVQYDDQWGKRHRTGFIGMLSRDGETLRFVNHAANYVT